MNSWWKITNTDLSILCLSHNDVLLINVNVSIHRIFSVLTNQGVSSLAFFVFYSVYGRPRTFLTHPTPSIDLPPWSYPTMEKKFCDFWVATSFLSSKALLLKKSTFFLLLLSSLHRFSKRKVLKEEGVCVFYSLTLRLSGPIILFSPGFARR